jgi:hypothetical protein
MGPGGLPGRGSGLFGTAPPGLVEAKNIDPIDRMTASAPPTELYGPSRRCRGATLLALMRIRQHERPLAFGLGCVEIRMRCSSPGRRANLELPSRALARKLARGPHRDSGKRLIASLRRNGRFATAVSSPRRLGPIFAG